MRDRNMPGRPREFDDTEMLRKIMGLFWKSGFEGVSLSHIMRETSLQKASLYAAFGDKRSMYLKALQQYHTDVVSAAAKALRDDSKPARARIEAFLSAPLTALEAKDRSGCFLCNASADQADLDEDTQAQVRRGFEQLGDAISSALAELYPELGQPARAARAQTLLAIYSGLRVIARSGGDPDQMRAAVTHAMTLV